MDRVVHFEIPADDLPRARKFYNATFGWKMNITPGINYTLVSTVNTDEKGMPKTLGAINGGLLKRQAPVKSPVITINVANIEKTVKEVVQQGCKLVRKKSKVGDMGLCRLHQRHGSKCNRSLARFGLSLFRLH